MIVKSGVQMIEAASLIAQFIVSFYKFHRRLINTAAETKYRNVRRPYRMINLSNTFDWFLQWNISNSAIYNLQT